MLAIAVLFVFCFSDFNFDDTLFNLSGMGCSTSLISIELAKNLLQRWSAFFPFIMGGGRKVLVVSTEILTPNFYHGNERSFLLHCYFSSKMLVIFTIDSFLAYNHTIIHMHISA